MKSVNTKQPQKAESSVDSFALAGFRRFTGAIRARVKECGVGYESVTTESMHRRALQLYQSLYMKTCSLSVTLGVRNLCCRRAVTFFPYLMKHLQY